MNKQILSLIVTGFLVVFTTNLAASSSGTSSKPLAGTYPIVLSHGFIGWGEDGATTGAIAIFNYWGGMDDYLRSQGASVLAVTKTAIASNETRAAEAREKILYWMAANGYSKVHVLAHSQGAPDSRYMISNLGMAGKVSTMTSLNGANSGVAIADIAESIIPSWMYSFIDTILNALGQFIYGSNQDIKGSLASISVKNMKTFNQYTPNAAGVKYFSYGGSIYANVLTHPFAIMQPITAAGSLIYGQGTANDGVVAVSSQKWGTWMGGPDLPWYKEGVDHGQACNALSMGETFYDVEAYFLKMAKNMKANQ